MKKLWLLVGLMGSVFVSAGARRALLRPAGMDFTVGSWASMAARLSE